MPYGSCKNKRFGGTYRPLHQGEESELGATLAVTSNWRLLEFIFALSELYDNKDFLMENCILRRTFLTNIFAVNAQFWGIHGSVVNFKYFCLCCLITIEETFYFQTTYQPATLLSQEEVQTAFCCYTKTVSNGNEWHSRNLLANAICAQISRSFSEHEIKHWIL
jgi:hypothetical protein